MYESNRLFPYVVPGYTGYIPKNEEEGGDGTADKRNCIPGYQGYLPHIRPENIIGKTYGKVSRMVRNEEVDVGTVLPLDKRYVSTTKEAYIDQIELRKTGIHYKNLPFKTTNVPTIRVDEAEYIPEEKKEPIAMSYEELRQLTDQYSKQK